jgi:hypothetical protein
MFTFAGSMLDKGVPARRGLNFKIMTNNNCSPEFLAFITAPRYEDKYGGANYVHTHDRVYYNVDTGVLRLDEICENEYGTAYYRGYYYSQPFDIKNLPAKFAKDPSAFILFEAHEFGSPDYV